jgi:hypothetical protein
MLGETCLRLKDYDNAVVAFRNVTRLAPDLPAGWYKLAFALSKTGQQQEAEAAYATYRGACGAEALLPMDGSGSYIFLSLEIGWGPILASDPLLGEFASYSRSYYREHYASVSVADRQVTGRKAEDVYQQAKDEANLAGDVAKKVASIAVKKAVSYIPYIGGLLAGSTAADVRKWLVLPGEIHFALVPVAPGIHDVTLRFYDEEKKELPDFQQTLYYLPAGPEGQAPLVCARSLYQIQNQRQK